MKSKMLRLKYKQILSIILLFAIIFGVISLNINQTLAEEITSFSIMLSAPAEFNPEGNAWVEEVNKKANADIEWIAFPEANFREKKAATMAGGDYPDVLIMDGLSDALYSSMVQHEIILPLDEFINEEYMPNIIEYTKQATWDAVRDPNGSAYMIPRSTIIREDFMATRGDWLERLGLEAPETIEEWREYFKAATAEDPDGNGVDDTYGTTEPNELIASGATSNINFFARSWHADKNWYLNKDGELFYGVFAKDGRFKYLLDFYRNLHEDGSLDPNFIQLQSSGDIQHRLEQGAVSSLRLFAGNLDRHLSVIQEHTPEATLKLVDFAESKESSNYEGETLVSKNPGLYYAWALTKKASGKEAKIISVLDWFLSDEGWNIVRNGVEGVHYEMDGDELVRLNPDYQLFSQYNGYVQLFRRPDDYNLWLKNIIPEMQDYEKEWLDYSIEYVSQYQQSGLMGIISQAEIEFDKSDLALEFPQLCVEIVYGEKDLDAWDDFLDRVYEGGWQKVTDEYNAYYQENVE